MAAYITRGFVRQGGLLFYLKCVLCKREEELLLTFDVCFDTCRTLEQGASVPVVYATAYYSLVVRGRLRPGESVLIHSGSGGVGQAAIAIALSKKCKVFTTVG